MCVVLPTLNSKTYPLPHSCDKACIAWKISDIKGIDPQFCTHKILMEENAKPVVQHQRRVNPKIHEVIKQEVIKLLDAGLIYPISDSPWVSPVHCVPKKGGITIVKNEEMGVNTHIGPCPLPFMDQMLERLAEWYYCFLDGFSGYFQIPIDPLDQERLHTFHPVALRDDLLCRIAFWVMQMHSTFTSKTMNEAQAQYTTTEKEYLPIHKPRLLWWILCSRFDVDYRDKKGAVKSRRKSTFLELKYPHQVRSRKRKITETFPPPRTWDGYFRVMIMPLGNELLTFLNSLPRSEHQGWTLLVPITQLKKVLRAQDFIGPLSTRMPRTLFTRCGDFCNVKDFPDCEDSHAHSIHMSFTIFSGFNFLGVAVPNLID
ncbi:hypothetical protein Tco_0368285 [Tanacetum coccineum]